MSRYHVDKKKNRIDVFFDKKPSDDILNELKADGFHWNPTRQCWYCYHNEDTEATAKSVVKKANGKSNTTGKSTSRSSTSKRETSTYSYIDELYSSLGLSTSITSKKTNTKTKTNSRKKKSESKTVQLYLEDVIVLQEHAISCEKKHKLETITIKVYVLNRRGNYSTVLLDAYYCSKCDVYFVNTDEYEKARVKGSFLCSVLDNISYLKEGRGDFSTLSDESILKRFGYGTGRANDLSDLQRQSILATLLDHRLIDKAAIVKKLTFFINMHKNRTEDYEQALIEWERDKSFVNKYTSTGAPKKKLSRR